MDVTREEIKSLLNASPAYLRNIIVCAIHTGMRKSETLHLQWSQIRGGLIYLEKTKTNESRQVPISDELAAIFEEIKQQQQPPSEHVFCMIRAWGERGKRRETR